MDQKRGIKISADYLHAAAGEAATRAKSTAPLDQKRGIKNSAECLHAAADLKNESAAVRTAVSTSAYIIEITFGIEYIEV